MIHKIFAIYDEKAHAYLTPFFLPTCGMAVRVFKDCCNSDSHQFGKHPSDYTLFEIGEFNDQSGDVQTRAVHKSLGNGITHVEQKVDEEQLSLPEMGTAGGSE